MKKCRVIIGICLITCLLFTGLPAWAEAERPLEGFKVAIDPGHQKTSDYRMEPIGPGMRGSKPRNKDGTAGVATRRRESIVNLEIALKLRDRFLALGADVHMTRETEDVKLSNRQRAAGANAYNPDVYLRLHCNSSSNRSVQGIRIYYPNGGLYAKKVASKGEYTRYATLLFKAMSKTTGQKKGGITSSNEYPGTNWSKSLTFLVEMGYMSNYQEDRLLSNPQYQDKLVEGMVGFARILQAEKQGKLVTKISLSKQTASLAVGKTLELKAKVLPATAQDKAVIWSSGNSKIATVDAKGKVTAIKRGTVSITATAHDGSGRKATCKVTVNK